MAKELKGAEIATRVSMKSGYEMEMVHRIMNLLFEEIGAALDKRQRVIIFNFGFFSVRDGANELPVVRFTPSFLMNSRVNVRPEMNKYSVLLDQNKTMTAKLSGKCPVCKSDLETVDPPKCPNCGTEPFEEKERMQHEDGNG